MAAPRRRRRPDRARSSPARSCRCWWTPPIAPPTACRAARTRSSTRKATVSTSCSSAPGPRCPSASTRSTCSTACRCAWCRCRRGTNSPRSPTTTASSCCRPTCRPSRSRQGQPSVGSATPTIRSASTTSVPRRRARSPWRSSGSPPSTSPRARRALVENAGE